VRPFTPDEIALIETFAAQAVIAIENVRQFRELQDRLAREAATRNILRVISESPDDEQPTFEAILDSATRLCGTPYASLVLGRRGDASQRMVAHREATAETLALFREGKVPMNPEDSIAARAILEGRTIHVPDMADTDQYRAGHERFRLVVDQQGLRTNLFVPLLGPDGAIGCFILWKKEVEPFTADQMALIETFASHAVIAIENVRQFKALEALNAELGDRVQEQVGEIERIGRLKRFLPSAVADAVVTSGSEKLLSTHRALLGVLFCDIRGFTAFCETAEPEETIEVLQTYHEEMGRLINAHDAGVDHRMGDGIMVLFNDPLPCDDPAGQAVRLAIGMRARMAELGQQWKRLGHRLGFGVGIALGYTTVGMVGSGGRFDYTASGTAVNLAKRLCDEALDGEILLSPRAAVALEDRFPVEPRGEATLKGIREPVEVFRLKPGP
jgi:class 3 adenylate cyclase